MGNNASGCMPCSLSSGYRSTTLSTIGLKTTELPNFIDPADLGDMDIYEKLKFEFPFYRINIE